MLRTQGSEPGVVQVHAQIQRGPAPTKMMCAGGCSGMWRPMCMPRVWTFTGVPAGHSTVYFSTVEMVISRGCRHPVSGQFLGHHSQDGNDSGPQARAEKTHKMTRQPGSQTDRPPGCSSIPGPVLRRPAAVGRQGVNGAWRDEGRGTGRDLILKQKQKHLSGCMQSQGPTGQNHWHPHDWSSAAELFFSSFLLLLFLPFPP